MPGHWYLICPSIATARGELHHPTGGRGICEVPRANSGVMWCKLLCHAHTVFKCIKSSFFFVWTKYSVGHSSSAICNTAYTKNHEHPFIPSNNIRRMKIEDQQDATIRCLLLTSVSTCFGHHYAHIQENKGPVTAYGVLFWLCWMWLVAVVGRCVVGCERC